MSLLKKCKHCDVELVIGENWVSSNAKCKNYKCKPCDNKSHKQWRIDNPEKYKNSKATRISEGRGVYLVKYRWINLYVGEGWFNDRKRKHLQWSFNKCSNSSKVAKLVDKRDLNRNYLSFTVLEYLDDKAIMLERETHYRRVLKPYINPLD